MTALAFRHDSVVVVFGRVVGMKLPMALGTQETMLKTMRHQIIILGGMAAGTFNRRKRSRLLGIKGRSGKMLGRGGLGHGLRLVLGYLVLGYLDRGNGRRGCFLNRNGLGRLFFLHHRLVVHLVGGTGGQKPTE